LNLLRGLLTLGLVAPAFAQYAGPAILSRGEAPAAMSAPNVNFTFSVAFTANYTDGLAGVSTPNAAGQLATQSSSGETITFGASGAHSWKHTHFGMNYSGSFSHYSAAGYFDGISQGLSMGVTHQFTRHIEFSLRESLGMFTEFAPGTVSLNSSVPFDPSQSYIPTTDFYNNRTYYDTSQANLTFQLSSRLSLDVGGAYFVNLFRSSALYGATGFNANGDLQYRISRRTTLGGSYNFAHYIYTHSLGGSYIHSVALNLSTRLNRWWEVSGFGGASRVESNFQQTVPIDPAILAILCPPSATQTCPLTQGVVISHNILWAPNFGVRLSRSFHRGVAYASAGESITPGNGLFLTTRAATAMAGYGYTGFRKWSLGLSVQYVTALSFGNVQGAYGDVMGAYSMSRQIVNHLSFVSAFSATQYRSNTFSGYNRLIYGASVGLGYSPGNIPVRFF
jgi:hypothetical protein